LEKSLALTLTLSPWRGNRLLTRSGNSPFGSPWSSAGTTSPSPVRRERAGVRGRFQLNRSGCNSVPLCLCGEKIMSRILIIEDETPMRTALKDVLEAEGYRVLTAADGESGLQCALDEKPDLILLDIMMPKLDGYEVCAELRRLSNPVPVLMLTAKGQVEDRVTGLDAGADDYLVKPFSTEELLARVRALLRRAQRQGKAAAKLKLGEVEIDLARQTAMRGRKAIHLTAKEFAMLRLMSELPGEPVSRERFLDVVWGYAAFPTTRTVDNHIASLRSKLEPNPESPRWIKTVHGVGYRLELEAK
jgi:DNA-binding response OmpR family regulator